MARTARASVGGLCYHVLNRGNARQEIFHKDADYEAFLTVLVESLEYIPMRVLAYALLPNHFHLVVWPREDGDLSRWMQRVMTSHVRRYHQHYHSQGMGHLWQGRFKAFPIQSDSHLLTVLRYVERNPLRAKLIKRAENWCWTSLPAALRTLEERQKLPDLLDAGPLPRPRNWRELVQEAQTPQELEALRSCVQRGTPWGGANWSAGLVKKLGLEHTLRPRGRPRKAE